MTFFRLKALTSGWRGFRGRHLFRSQSILLGALSIAILFSGIPHLKQRLRLAKQWSSAPDSSRHKMLYGPSYQLILEGQRTLPSHADILLFSQQDPALLPYYFYPRRIYQIWVMPETDHIYMDLPTPHYPVRPPQSFDADYRIDLFRGGDFIIRKVLKNKKEE